MLLCAFNPGNELPYGVGILGIGHVEFHAKGRFAGEDEVYHVERHEWKVLHEVSVEVDVIHGGYVVEASLHQFAYARKVFLFCHFIK